MTPTPSPQPDPETRRPGAGGRVLFWSVVIAATLGGALLLDVARQAAAGPDLVPWTRGYETALAAARDQDKPILAYFTADWCPPCQAMKAEVYSRADVAETIDQRAVPLMVDLTDQAPGPEAEVAARYGVTSIPTLVLLDASGKEISRVVGFIPSDELLGWLDATDPATTVTQAGSSSPVSMAR